MIILPGLRNARGTDKNSGAQPLEASALAGAGFSMYQDGRIYTPEVAWPCGWWVTLIWSGQRENRQNPPFTIGPHLFDSCDYLAESLTRVTHLAESLTPLLNDISGQQSAALDFVTH